MEAFSHGSSDMSRWLKNTLAVIGRLFGNLSESTVSRELSFLLPILYTHLPGFDLLNTIPHNSPQYVAVVDCTSHQRNRVHPGQALYYRGDKHCHFITAQVVCSVKGQPIQVKLAFGHNNDSGMLRISGLKHQIMEYNWKFLGDRGYGTPIVTPRDSRSEQWLLEHARKRAVVEILIGFFKGWEVASGRVTLSPGKHFMSLMVVYKLGNMMLQTYHPTGIRP